jgi:hypothetical protein
MVVNLMKRSYPLLLGTWILRSTNDNKYSDGLSYMIINPDNSIKFRTLIQEGPFGKKKSTTGIISNITLHSDLNYSINLNYLHSNTYSYSFIGVEIPEIKSDTKKYILNKNYDINIYDKSLLITDKKLPLYYLFDLNIGKINNPFIETGLNTFIFTQLASFILNLILANTLHNIFFN